MRKSSNSETRAIASRRDSFTVSSTSLPVLEFRERLMAWGPSGFQHYPWRKKLPLWKGLLVEVMLQRTRADQVAPSFRCLDSCFPTARSLRNMDESGARDLIGPLGLSWRIPLFVELCREIAEHGGRLPRDMSALQNLPGVGPYAAGAALSLHGETRAVIVDSNVVRVLCRFLGVPFDGETRRKKWVEEALEHLTPENDFRAFNYALLDLAMQVCRPRRPDCGICPLQTLCRTGSDVPVASGS